MRAPGKLPEKNLSKAKNLFTRRETLGALSVGVNRFLDRVSGSRRGRPVPGGPGAYFRTERSGKRDEIWMDYMKK